MTNYTGYMRNTIDMDMIFITFEPDTKLVIFLTNKCEFFSILIDFIA